MIVSIKEERRIKGKKERADEKFHSLFRGGRMTFEGQVWRDNLRPRHYAYIRSKERGNTKGWNIYIDRYLYLQRTSGFDTSDRQIEETGC